MLQRERETKICSSVDDDIDDFCQSSILTFKTNSLPDIVSVLPSPVRVARYSTF